MDKKRYSQQSPQKDEPKFGKFDRNKIVKIND